MRKLMGFIATLLMTACMDASEVSAQTAGGGTVVRDVSIQSTVLGREMLYSVYLPAGYTSSKQYPVLYLLHGYGGDQNDWWVFDDMADDADAMISSGEIPEMIIVTPDGGTWMYIDNCYGNGINYEQYFFQELIADVESRYSIRRNRQSRVIGGFSMGGYGAVDMSEIVRNYLPSDLPGITLECGDRDYFTYENREFSALLKELGIAHDHIERSGGHDWTFWSACTPKILQKAGDLFKDTTDKSN